MRRPEKPRKVELSNFPKALFEPIEIESAPFTLNPDPAVQERISSNYHDEVSKRRLEKLDLLFKHYGAAEINAYLVLLRLAIDVFPGFRTTDDRRAPRAAHRPRTRGK